MLNSLTHFEPKEKKLKQDQQDQYMAYKQILLFGLHLASFALDFLSNCLC